MNVKDLIKHRQFNVSAYIWRDYSIVPRDSYLRSIEGTYPLSVPPTINRCSPLAHYLYVYFGYEERTSELYCNCGCGNNQFGPLDQKIDSLEPPKEVQEVLETGLVGRLAVGRFFQRIYRKDYNFDLYDAPAFDCEVTISCKYRDILKCSDSRNFHSCFEQIGMYCTVPLQYLKNPGVAVAFVRDKSGKFSSRVFLYLGSNNEILIGRPYGIIEDRRVWARAFKNLNTKIPRDNWKDRSQRFYPKYSLKDVSYSDIMFSTDSNNGKEFVNV